MNFKDIIYKEAGFPVGAVDDIAKAIPKAFKNLPKKKPKVLNPTFKNYDEITDYIGKSVGGEGASPIINKKILDGGTGSLFMDAGLGLAKKIKPLKPKIEDGVLKMKKGLDTLDMKAGNALGKNNKIFDQVMDFDLGKSEDGLSENIKRLRVKRLTAPYAKAKDAILPMAGAMTISSQLYKPKKEEEAAETYEQNYSR